MTADTAASPPDPTQFSSERFEANLRWLVDLGPRVAGGAALERAHEWATANAPNTQPDAPVALAASLTAEGSGDALVEENSGAALVLEAARVLAARGEPVRLAFSDGASVPPLAGAEAVVFVRRACALPQRRDLLSHRVLRERFFRAADVAGFAFEQSDGPHAALRAAGAKRVVVLDGPRVAGTPCTPGRFGDVLVRFVTDATALLARGRDK